MVSAGRAKALRAVETSKKRPASNIATIGTVRESNAHQIELPVYKSIRGTEVVLNWIPHGP